MWSKAVDMFAGATWFSDCAVRKSEMGNLPGGMLGVD